MLSVIRISIVLTACCVIPPTAAREPLEEIVVTAGFYETSLMQSTGSISVLDEQVLRDRSARHLDEALNAFPNVNYSSGGSRARFLQVRGVGDLEQFVDPKHYPSVGITVDDIDLGTSAATAAILMDVEEIEILRGPQGTRFGANALAGMVNIQTTSPPEEITGNVEAGFGNYDAWYAGLALGGPLTDSLRGRLAVQQNRSDGFIHNAYLNSESTNDRDELTLRGKVHWYGGNGARINLTGLYLDVDSGYDAFSLDNNRTTWSDTPGNDRQETYALAAKAMVPVREEIELEVLLNGYQAEEAYGFDEDWVFSGYCNGIRCNPLFEFSSSDQLYRDRDMASIDARLKSAGSGVLDWVGGIYYQQRDEDLERQHFAPFFSDYASERYAVYGQLRYAPAEAWQITTGFRYEHFADDYSDTNDLVTESADDYWTGELTLEYLTGDETLFYATLSRGVKPGGVNTETSSNQPFMSAVFQSFITSRLQFAAETLVNKELGLKGRYLDDRLAVRLSLFHMDRFNAQLESWVWDAGNFIWTGFLDSSSDAQNYGAELEFDYRLRDNLGLFARIGYLQTNVDQLTVFDLDTSQFRTLRDRDQAKAPEWQYNLGLELDLTGQLHGRFVVEGRDRSYFGYYHNGLIGGYTLAHASISYELGDLTLQGWIRNITDEDYSVHALYFANDPRDGFAVNRTYYQFGEPRVFGINASYAF